MAHVCPWIGQTWMEPAAIRCFSQETNKQGYCCSILPLAIGVEHLSNPLCLLLLLTSAVLSRREILQTSLGPAQLSPLLMPGVKLASCFHCLPSLDQLR